MKPVPVPVLASNATDTVWRSGAVHKSTMTLRIGSLIHGECVDKATISQLLGCVQDASASKNERKHWSLAAPDSEEADVDTQVAWIFSRLTPDMAIWQQLATAYSMDLFCGLFLDRNNQGITVSPKTLCEIGARGIELGFDIYAPEEVAE